MEEPARHRAFFFAAAGGCLFLGLAQGLPALVALALALLLLAARSYLRGRRRLRRLHVRRELEASAFEDDEVRVQLVLENHGREPVSLVEVVDAFGPALADRQVLLDPGPLLGGRRRRLAYRTTCSRLWGVYLVGPLTVRLSDPLGLFPLRGAPADLRPFDLFPRVHPASGLERLGSRASYAPSEPTAARAGQSAAYLGVRDYRPGDDVRRVHWPATARRGFPMVKEFEQDLMPYFTLFLDLEREKRAGTGQKSTLEYVVRTAACLLASAARRGDLVQAFGEGARPLLVPPGRGELHLAHALDQLIRVRQAGSVPLLDLVERERETLPAGSTATLLSASVFLDMGRLAETLAAMRARRVQAVLVAVDKDSFVPIDRRPRARSEVEAQCRELAVLAEGQGARVAVLSADQELPEELARPDWLEAG
jgi:uncharacterized protein (DUF58 family)